MLRSCILGWRQFSYEPDAVDYLAYETRRDAFLSQPRARAALLKGGIVWRLAREHIHVEDVLNGPSDDAHQYPKVLCTSDGRLVEDDDLTEDELNLICGVYEVALGTFLLQRKHIFY